MCRYISCWLLRSRRSVLVGVCLALGCLVLAACGPDLALLNADHGLYLNAITMTGPGTGYAVGVQPGQHRSVLLRATQGAWALDGDQPPVTTGDDLKAVVVQGTTLWVAGSNTDDAHGNATQLTGFIAQRGSDGTWHRTKLGAPINALAFPAPDDGWAVGNNGLIVHLQAGSWVAVPDAMSDTLLTIAFRTPHDGWAAGEMGAFVHFDGTSWVHPPHLTHETVNNLVLTNDDGWAAGTNGTLFRLQAGQWGGYTAPINVNNDAVALTGDNLWIAGDHGSVFQFNIAMAAWQHIAPPADLQLTTLAVDPAGTLWTGGNSAQATIYALNSSANGASWRAVTVALGTT